MSEHNRFLIFTAVVCSCVKWCNGIATQECLKISLIPGTKNSPPQVTLHWDYHHCRRWWCWAQCSTIRHNRQEYFTGQNRNRFCWNLRRLVGIKIFFKSRSLINKLIKIVQLPRQEYWTFLGFLEPELRWNIRNEKLFLITIRMQYS